MDTSNLKAINDINAEKALQDTRHHQLLSTSASVSDTVLSATMSLINYLEGHTSKTLVVNQLKSINTPDALRVIPYLEKLDKTLQTHENTDLTEITSVMNSILDEAKKIPKELPKEKEEQFIDYSKQLSSLSDAIKAIEKVIKAQKTVIEAPIVNVPQASVHVDAPDLKPLQKDIQDVVTAVTKIVLPSFTTDNKEVEQLLKTSNKLLKELLEKPVRSGGGGGGSSWIAVNTAGTPIPIQLNSNGSVPISNSVVTERYDYSSSTSIYTGSADIGTSDASTGWTIVLYDLASSSAASGKVATNVSWNNRATGSFN